MYFKIHHLKYKKRLETSNFSFISFGVDTNARGNVAAKEVKWVMTSEIF